MQPDLIRQHVMGGIYIARGLHSETSSTCPSIVAETIETGPAPAARLIVNCGIKQVSCMATSTVSSAPVGITLPIGCLTVAEIILLSSFTPLMVTPTVAKPKSL